MDLSRWHRGDLWTFLEGGYSDGIADCLAETAAGESEGIFW